MIMIEKSESTTEYWESRFRNEGIMWKFDPSDSAIETVSLFRKENINKILIPGFGYGRNALLFIQNGFDVTGIEISSSAIKLARENGIKCDIHHGSVNNVPFDNLQYEGIFCYALIHLLNKNERSKFLKGCFDQLKPNGLMVFTLATTENGLFGKGKLLSRNRYELSKGLRAYFYDSNAIEKEFSGYGIIECRNIIEPVKFMEGNETIILKYVACRKNPIT
jgi:SAM-dependent methyltransferase